MCPANFPCLEAPIVATNNEDELLEVIDIQIDAGGDIGSEEVLSTVATNPLWMKCRRKVKVKQSKEKAK